MSKINLVYVAELEIFLDQIQRVCYFCGKPITELNGKGTNSLVIHHINGDDNDNSLENRVFTHHGCHTKHHILQRPEIIQKFVEAGIKDSRSRKSRPNVSKSLVEWHKNNEHPMTGRKFSPESIKKMVDSWRKWWDSLTPEEQSKLQSERAKHPRPNMVEWYKNHEHPMKGRKLTEEAKEKLRLTNLGNQYRKGHKLSEEHNRKLHEANIGNKYTKGRKLSEKHKQALWEGNKRWLENGGRETISKKFSGKNNPFYGKTHTEATRERIRESNRRRAGKVNAILVRKVNVNYP